MAYVLGFFAADGSMVKNRRGGCYVEFQITDRDILLLIQKAFGSNHAISVRNRAEGHSTIYRFQLGSKRLFTDLEKHGFTQKKSKTLVMPIVPRRFLGDFIRGYFDGDGCVYFKKLQFADRKNPRPILQIVFTCGNRDFLVRLRGVLHTKGLRGGSIRKKIRGFDLLLSHRDSLALYGLMYHTVPTTELYLVRKRELFRKGLSVLYPDAVVV